MQGTTQEDNLHRRRVAPHALPAVPPVPHPVEPNVKQQQQQQPEREVPRPPAKHPGPVHEAPHGDPRVAPAPPVQRAPGIGQQAEHRNEQHRKNVPTKEKLPNEER